jgi:hypothetical protein
MTEGVSDEEVRPADAFLLILSILPILCIL